MSDEATLTGVAAVQAVADRGADIPRGGTQPLPPLLLRASAGTGKTYQLTGRLLRLLLAGAPLESVLATTFTRKAAGEILDRVLVTLARAASDDGGPALDQLRMQVGGLPVSRQQCLQLLHNVVRDVHRLRICTLDSLFSQLARSFPFELGLPAGWRLTDEIEEMWLRERAVDATLAALEPAEVTALLSMLGKGEVRRSVQRELLGVIADGYADARRTVESAWQTLRVPAAPDAAALTRAAGVLHTAVVGHRSAEKKLQQIAADIDARRWELVCCETPVIQAGALSSGNPLTYYRKTLPDDVAGALRIAYEAAKTEVLSLLRMQTDATGQVLRAYDRQIDQVKQGLRALAFDDVAFRLARWIGDSPAGRVSHRLDGTIDHLLLDEFQDTSPEQWRVLRPLAQHAAGSGRPGPAQQQRFAFAEADSGTGSDQPQPTEGLQNAGGPPPSFFCVGDSKQAIYGWRGGVAAIFDAVTDSIAGVCEAQQDKSFRSSPVITGVVTDVFQNLPRHPQFGQDATDPQREPRTWYEAQALQRFAHRFPAHQSARPELPGFVRLAAGPQCDGPAAEKQLALQRYAADQVAELAAAAPQRSVGVLTRTNATLARLIYLLRARGVDVSQEGGNPLTDSAAVELMLSALMLSEHPGDGRWWFHVRHSPLARSGLLQGADDALTASVRVRRLVEQSGLTAALRQLADPLAAACNASDCLRLRQLLQLAQQFEWNPQPRLCDFVRLVRQKRVERPQPAQVRVMTVHQAKGLEFDTVVLPELDGNLTRQGRKCITRCRSAVEPPDGILRYIGNAYWHYLPDDWQAAFGAHAAGLMTEALCLLYVSLTRARHALHVLASPAAKPGFTNKTAASLMYHALQCDADPTAGQCDWFTAGDPHWYRQLPNSASPNPAEAGPKPRQVRFMPLPDTPRRNHTVG